VNVCLQREEEQPRGGGSAGPDNSRVDEAAIEREDVLVIMGALADLVVYVRDIRELLGEDGDEEGDEEGES
jgi:hypothetical protein